MMKWIQNLKEKERKKLYILIFLSIFILVILIVLPYLAPNDPLEIDFTRVLSLPDALYPLGGDHLGRCIYSRLLHGARITIGTALLMIASMSLVGIALGALAGFRGGYSDKLVMRLGDILLAFPEIVFVIVIVSALGVGIFNTILALSMIWWVKYSRLTRILVQKEINSNYIHVARMSGAGNIKIFSRYILPNIIPILLVQIFLNIGTIIIALTGFSFLGLGVQPPTPEWGNMLSESRIYIQTAPHLMLYPGILIFVAVMLFNYIGELIRSILTPS